MDYFVINNLPIKIYIIRLMTIIIIKYHTERHVSLNNIYIIRIWFLYVWMYVYIYPTPPPWAECDTRSIFEQSIAGLKAVFSFYWTVCLTNIKEPILSIAGREQLNLCLSSGQSETQSQPGFELGLLILFPTMITVSLNMPPLIFVCLLL